MKNTNQVTGKEAWSLQRAAKDVSVKSGSPLGLEISPLCFSHLDSHNSPLLHLCQRKSNSFAKNLFLPKARMPSRKCQTSLAVAAPSPHTPFLPDCERQRGQAGTRHPVLGSCVPKAAGHRWAQPGACSLPWSGSPSPCGIGRAPEAAHPGKGENELSPPRRVGLQ